MALSEPLPLPADSPDVSRAQPRSPESPVRVALVGAGYVADFHLEALAEIDEVAVAAICDLQLSRARAAAARWNVPVALSSLEELADHRIDIAHVLVPPDLHATVARRLLGLGIGVFIEKPLALSSLEARELQQLAERHRLAFAANHNNLFHPAFERLREILRQGRIGRLQHVQATLSVSLPQLDRGEFAHWMFREPRNIVFEQAPHPLSQVHALVGRLREGTATILGSRELGAGKRFHDRWVLVATAERGTAEIHLAFNQGFEHATIRALATDGCVEADLVHDLVWLEEKTPWLGFWNSFLAGWRRGTRLRRDAWRGLARYARHTLGLSRREDPYFTGMRRSIRTFYAALAAGSAPPAGGTEAAEVLEWCEALARVAAPAAPGQRVSIPSPLPPRAGEIAVLGATGFIGRRVVERLLAAGLPVTALVRRSHALPPALVEGAGVGRLRLLPGDLGQPDALRQGLAGTSVVVHLATGGGATWEEVRQAMVEGTVAAAEAALAAGVRRFIYVSSIAALYLGPDCGEDLIEDTLEVDPRPERRDVYTRGKIAAEEALLDLHRRRGLPLVIARPGVVLGEGAPMQHSGLGLWVRDNHCVGWGHGRHPLPLVHVDDVAEALVRIVRLEGSALHGKALNLCSRVPLSAAEVVGELSRATGRRIHFHPRPLWLSLLLEIGKWGVKRAGRRPGATFPSYRDLKSRAIAPAFSSRTARETLRWQPLEGRREFLEKIADVYGRPDRPPVL